MPVNYKIQAEVVDIRVDRPRNTDLFLIDTNVWLWLTYPFATPQPYQGLYYPNYFAGVLNNSASLIHKNLSLSELAHLIEINEWREYNLAASALLTEKEFRHNLANERKNVVNQIQLSWDLVRNYSQSLPTSIDDATTDAVLARLATQALDGYDLFMIEAMLKAGMTQVITDDGDYVVVPGIQVFTANRNVLDIARQQGKLITR